MSAQVHYTGLSPEPIDVIESWNLNFRIGNALKYIARAGRKDDAVRDYRKAISYIQREINALSTGKPAW